MQLNHSRQVGFALAPALFIHRTGARANATSRLLLFGIALTTLSGFSDPGTDQPSRGGNRMSDQTCNGEWGAPLQGLARFYTAPNPTQASTHLIDMWEGTKLAVYVTGAGLTNHRALIVNSHARARRSGRTQRYAIYPHETRVRSGEKVPYYSAQDLATFLGPKTSASIHNIVLGGCNVVGALKPAEWLACFPNATNIVHAPAGEAGYQPMFLQVLFSHSSQIQPLYENRVRSEDGTPEFILSPSPGRQAVRIHPYQADLFRAGETRPYRRQVAGRELLLSTTPVQRLAATDR